MQKKCYYTITQRKKKKRKVQKIVTEDNYSGNVPKMVTD